MRILITGGTGSLGRRVVARAAAAGAEPIGTSLSAPGSAISPAAASVRLDIRDRADVRRVLREVRPDAVVHAAAGRDRNDWPANADGAANVAVVDQVRAVPVRRPRQLHGGLGGG
ncbi:NAD-dependent epimerase/dehydratase family protein, partial [Actinoplanes missouriensis]|uniref:NAD-dependent epimerase/dehydratase family protein n=1 Tax=Actinoplanes missouriensis TaxID=1866 RepID=UPI0033D4A634